MSRYLIVNADDFGLSTGINRGVIECAEHGILTSASLMVRYTAAVDAAAYAKQNRNVSVGLHVDLGEWVLHGEKWEPLYTVVEADDATAAAKEIYHQVAEFRRLVGRDPSHLDSHQHVHRNEPARSIMQKLTRELGVPLRECDSNIHYCGDFYGQSGGGEPLPGLLTVANFEKILISLPDGVSEIGCHPGYGDNLASPYRYERAKEIGVLCNSQIRQIVARLGFQLCHFGSLERIMHSKRQPS